MRLAIPFGRERQRPHAVAPPIGGVASAGDGDSSRPLARQPLAAAQAIAFTPTCCAVLTPWMTHLGQAD